MLSENECNNTLFFKGQKGYTLFVEDLRLLTPPLSHIKGPWSGWPLIKANKSSFSQQMKLQRIWYPSCCQDRCSFYTEKKTLNWIPLAVITFVWVASSYPDWREAPAKFDPHRHKPSTQRKGILTFFLFSKFGLIPSAWPIFDQFGLALRSTHSMLITIASKTFLTSVVKILTWLFATTTKICTDAWSR